MSLDLFPELQCRREFLGWDRPVLAAAVEFFIEQAFSIEQADGENATAQESQHRDVGGDVGGDVNCLDLGDWVVVLPTAQAVSRFETLLRQRCVSDQFDLVAPEIVTSGDVAERLYRPEKPIAIEFEQTLAWARVLRERSPESLRPLLPVLPESDGLTPWLEVAGTLRRLSADLAAHNVDFSEVLELAEGPAETQRWSLLGDLYGSYLNELASAGLSDQHQQRRHAVKRRKVRSAKKIALIGTADLNESVSNVLAEIDRDLLALIAAPESQKGRFDWLGRIRTEAFSDWELPIKDGQLVAAADITDQSIAVTEDVTRYRARFDNAAITVGVTDESQVAPVEMELEACGIASHRNLGWAIASTAIGRLIDLTSTLVARPTWQSLAALVRHGQVHRHLHDRLRLDGNDLLVSLDQLLANHFPVRLADPLPPVAVKRYPDAVKLRQAVYEMLANLTDERKGGKPKAGASKANDRSPFRSDTFSSVAPIASWCDRIMSWMDSLYSDSGGRPTESDSQRLTDLALSSVRELLGRFSKLSRHLDVPVTLAGALETLSGRLAEMRINETREEDEIQILGWLDLALDDSQAMVVAGLNHPFVPSSVTSDPFLPGTLRSRLRIADNERRYARDIYAAQLMLSSRKDVRFVVGKSAADGSPTPPSRLLAAAPAADVARRIRNCLSGTRETFSLQSTFQSGLEHSQLPIPELSLEECPVTSMSVTAFKSYLECPFRFYLRHVLKLKPVDDASRELAANQFGDLAHGAVELFGESAEKDESEEKHIFAALRHHLHEYARSNYGEHADRAVGLQVQQAERRLRFVAAEQAKRIAKGWTIHATEASVSESSGACVIVDGKQMGLRGRFDRIDWHEQTGRWAILDYKTHGDKPEKKHLRKNRESGETQWIDLQLPLYRMMVPFLGIDAVPQEVELGYFNISDKPEKTKINVADFSDGLMKQADELIHQCVRRIFACDFKPTGDRVQYDDYEMILQTGVASRMLAGSDGGSDE